MERASRLLGKLCFPAASVSAEELARAAWPIAVGRRIAAHARASRLVANRLVVEVEDAVWMRQLNAMSRQIQSKLNHTLGQELIGGIEFRVVPPRREVQRAQRSAAEFELTDEADRIADPVMRGIYRAARRKAQA